MSDATLPEHAREAGARVAERFMRRSDYAHSYTNDLALEGLLWWGASAGDRSCAAFVRKVMTGFRGWTPGQGLTWRANPFTLLHVQWFLFTGERDWIAGFVEDAERCRREVARSSDGGAAFVYRPETGRIFVDMLQQYASRMAFAGRLSGDVSFYKEAVAQYELQRNALRDPATGLWSQGRGWGPTPDFVSPLGWLRGQGWVLRGMVDVLSFLPADSAHAEPMRRMLAEFASDLLRWQDRRGMWHQVPHRANSYQETTGTGLFVHALFRAVAQGFLPAEPYLAAAERGLKALCGFVSADGTVLNGSFGCGPLFEEEDYLHRPAPPGDAHTPGTTLLACAAPALFGAGHAFLKALLS